MVSPNILWVQHCWAPLIWAPKLSKVKKRILFQYCCWFKIKRRYNTQLILICSQLFICNYTTQTNDVLRISSTCSKTLLQYCIAIDVAATWMSLWTRVAWDMHKARLAKLVAIYSITAGECTTMQVNALGNQCLIQSMTHRRVQTFFWQNLIELFW